MSVEALLGSICTHLSITELDIICSRLRTKVSYDEIFYYHRQGVRYPGTAIVHPGLWVFDKTDHCVESKRYYKGNYIVYCLLSSEEEQNPETGEYTPVFNIVPLSVKLNVVRGIQAFLEDKLNEFIFDDEALFFYNKYLALA